MKKIFFWFALMPAGITHAVQAQPAVSPLADGCFRLSAYSGTSSGFNIIRGNPASLSQLRQSMSAVYAEQKFALPGFHTGCIAAGFTTRAGNLGFGFNQGAFAGFRHSLSRLYWAKDLAKGFSAGAGFVYEAVHLPEFGTGSAISFEGGILLDPAPGIHTGFAVFNPAGGRFRNLQQEKIPASYSWGIGYTLSGGSFIAFEAEKTENRPIKVSAGFCYQPVKPLQIQAGISTAGSLAWGGAGFSGKLVNTDVVIAWHPQLGITPGLMLSIHFGKKRDDDDE